MTTELRPASAADDPAIARVRRESWFAAYSGIIDPGLIDRATETGGQAADPPPYRRTLVAVAAADGAAADGASPAVVGYAAFGPERAIGFGDPAGTLTPAGLAGDTGEVYAIYLAPAWWSTGTGHALMSAALDGLRSAGCRRVVLWTLTDNARARRFYERGGFAPDGGTNVLAGLGGVEEVRYARGL